MAKKEGAQKFTNKNRHLRVQIGYDPEVYGTGGPVNLPFVMGVMADLSRKPVEPLPPIADRTFLEIDIDNFNDRLKAMKPRVEFQVPNAITGQGNLSVDLTFENMDDFSPAAVARKVEGVQQLLEARTQLANLLTYIDEKTDAKQLIAQAINNPSLLQSLISVPNPGDGTCPQ